MFANLLYIDPAAASVLLTSISSIVIALGATFIILWNKAKKKACQVLRIDENAKKEVEDDIVITDAEIATETNVAVTEQTEETATEEAVVNEEK